MAGVLDLGYWEARYQKGETGWNVGHISPPMKYLIDRLVEKSQRILIPGCGYGWEGEYLWNRGFANIALVDGAPTARAQFLKRVPSFPPDQFICADFFDLNDCFDLILEQTFLSALHPDKWNHYAKKTAALLGGGGSLRGVVFTKPNPGHEGPPFWSDTDGYRKLFTPFFNRISIQDCTLSLKPRLGREAIIDLNK